MSARKWLPALKSIVEVISNGNLKVEGRFVDASNATLYAVVELGEQTIPAIYKPIAGERPLWDFPDGNLANRELAAYLLSDALKFDIVPFTILREGPLGVGMVQQWIDIDEEVDVVELATSTDPKIRQMALFDAIINNTDRKYGHILPTGTGEIFGCDHGVTFHEDPKLRTVIWQFAGENFTPIEINLLETANAKAAEVVGSLITSAESAALISRIEGLLAAGTFPEPREDWPAVPWPPF